MRALIALLPGDGIGPEVTAEAARVLTAVAELYGHAFTLREAPIGGAAIEATEGAPTPATTALPPGCPKYARTHQRFTRRITDRRTKAVRIADACTSSVRATTTDSGLALRSRSERT